MSEDTDWLTPKEVAAELKVSEMTVYRVIKNGKLDAIRVGYSYRIKRNSLNTYINNSRVAVTENE